MTVKGTLLAHNGRRFRKIPPGSNGEVPVYDTADAEGIVPGLGGPAPGTYVSLIKSPATPVNGTRPQFTFAVATGTPSAGTFDVTLATPAGDFTTTLGYHATTSQVAAAIAAAYLAATGNTATVLCAGGPLGTLSLTAQIQLFQVWTVVSVDNTNVTGGTYSATLSTPGVAANVQPEGTLWIVDDSANLYIQTSSNSAAPTWKKFTVT